MDLYRILLRTSTGPRTTGWSTNVPGRKTLDISRSVPPRSSWWSCCYQDVDCEQCRSSRCWAAAVGRSCATSKTTAGWSEEIQTRHMRFPGTSPTVVLHWNFIFCWWDRRRAESLNPLTLHAGMFGMWARECKGLDPGFTWQFTCIYVGMHSNSLLSNADE